MKTTHLTIYTLRDLRLQGMVSAHSHGEVNLSLNPDQFIEICVIVGVEGWAGPVNPGTCSPLLCIPVTMQTKGSTSKNANILPGDQS